MIKTLVRFVRRQKYALSFRRRLARLRKEIGRPVNQPGPITPDAPASDLWAALNALALPRVSSRIYRLREDGAWPRYWERHGGLYAKINNGREKALEHALTVVLLDMTRVRRYCDVAAAESPIERAIAADHPGVEFWKQDCLYQNDMDRRILGGFAQHMNGVPAGFFDALTLHCSYEHFNGDADSAFVGEVDRVLSPTGACLILPLYVARTPRIFFDPTAVASFGLKAYDTEAELRPVFNYHQEHGRFYSPATLAHRVLGHLPESLQATLLWFADAAEMGSEFYLCFGLVLHRPNSVFVCPASPGPS